MNECLLKNPNLLKDKAETEGWIAIVKPYYTDISKLCADLHPKQ